MNFNAITSGLKSWTLAAVKLALMSWLLILSQPAGAFTAHCLCREAADQGGTLGSLNNYVKDFGTVATYTGLFVQNQAHQNQCRSACAAAEGRWSSEKLNVCSGFYASNGRTLKTYYKLGSLAWVTTGGAIDAGHFGYPQSCFSPSGRLSLSYYILTLAYATPGCTPSSNYDCADRSYVEYGSGSTTGATTSIEQSIEDGTVLTATIGSDNNTWGGSFGYSVSQTSGSSATVSKEVNTVEKFPNGSNDGINHDGDVFVLLLDPIVTVSTWRDPVTLRNNAQWSLGAGAVARTRKVQVSYLRCALAGVGPGPGGPYDHNKYDSDNSCENNAFLLMPGKQDARAKDGFLPGVTNADYREILNQDLFWSASPVNPITVPTPRFTRQRNDFSYQPPLAINTPVCGTLQRDTSYTNSVTATSSSKTEYKASITATAGTGIFKLTAENDFTFSDQTSSESTKSDSQTISILIGCSSPGWTGINDIAVYYDNIFDTFLFKLDDHSDQVRILHGHVREASGAAVPGVPVKLVDRTGTYQTFTDNKGNFAFYDQPDTRLATRIATLSVNGISKRVFLGPWATTEVVIPRPSPVLTVAVQTRPEGSANLSMGVTNLSGITTATNVTVTEIKEIKANGATYVYSPGLLQIPFVIPGAAALTPNAKSGFNLNFTTPSGGAATLPFSFVITVKADNVPTFSTTIHVP